MRAIAKIKVASFKDKFSMFMAISDKFLENICNACNANEK